MIIPPFKLGAIWFLENLMINFISSSLSIPDLKRAITQLVKSK